MRGLMTTVGNVVAMRIFELLGDPNVLYVKLGPSSGYKVSVGGDKLEINNVVAMNSGMAFHMDPSYPCKVLGRVGIQKID
jgi:hypothetical protein